MEKQKVLIVDDSEMNRVLLTDILEGQYEVTEAENGRQAMEILNQNETDFWFILLDIMMPEKDGFAVLEYIRQRYWNDRVVVMMMISSDDSPENISRAYSLGAFDYIGRPFDPMIVRKRIANTLLLFARQHDLEKTVREQFLEQQKNNDLMVSILSHIVEFRNGESGLHIQHVKAITELLLRQLAQCTDRYALSEDKIALISTASAIHDVGKISIPAEILNKPGRLTPEEFEIMKTHAKIGTEMLSDLPTDQSSSELVEVAYGICRWHHERYDGRGYPDGLKGEEIPIAAQVVAMADVYDALTSERCYKKAFSHEVAIEMIQAGKCGTFNPLLLQCLVEISDRLKRSLENVGQAWNEEPNRKQGSRSRQQTHSQQPGYKQLLYVDPLTQVYNRRYFQEYIQENEGVAAAILVDVDELKEVNKTYGQEAGDLLLRRTGETLQSLIRKSDPVIRYEGDGFLLVFSSMAKSTFQARLEEIGQRFRELTEQGWLQSSVSVTGFWGPGQSRTLLSMVASSAGAPQYPKGQVTIRFLDEKESGSI